jgi:hypothetical protein
MGQLLTFADKFSKKNILCIFNFAFIEGDAAKICIG